MRSPPDSAYLWGVLPQGPWVSLIGTRRPSQEGERTAFEVARQLAQLGVCVVSGGAVGVDAAAHRGALEAGGATLVVAPSWLRTAYPLQNRDLFFQVLDQGGGYLTVARPSQPLFNAAFFQRNEALVALSDAVILGDCPVRSGARNAMQHARRMEKPRFCLPGQFGAATSLGGWVEANELGATPLVHLKPLVDMLRGQSNAGWSERFVDYLVAADSGIRKQKRRKTREPSLHACGASRLRSPALSEQSAPTDLPTFEGCAELQCVAQAVYSGCVTPDSIAERTGLEIAVVQHQILLLTLQGLVFEDETGILRYHASRS